MNEQKSAPVMRADCAAAAAGALLNPSLSENQIFDVTGPDLYSRRDLVKAVNAMTGKKIEVTEVIDRPPSGGAPAGPAAPSAPYVPLGPPAGTPAVVSDAVAKLSDRPAMGYKPCSRQTGSSFGCRELTLERLRCETCEVSSTITSKLRSSCVHSDLERAVNAKGSEPRSIFIKS